MEMAQYLNVFMDECQEHLHTLNTSLLALESNPEDTGLLDAIFRAAHTLKGASATMGFNKMANITHAMEDVLSKMRTGEVSITSEIVNLLFECFDLLDALAQGIATGHEEEIEASGLLSQLRMVVSGGQGEARGGNSRGTRRETRPEYSAEEKAVVARGVESGLIPYHVTVRLRPDCLLKGARAFMVLREVERTGEVVRTWPPVKDLEDENFEDQFIVSLLSPDSPEKPQAAAASITDVLSVTIDRVDPANLPMAAEAMAVNKEPSRSASASRTASAQRFTASQTVRVEIKKLDDLMNLVAELVIQRSQLEQISTKTPIKELGDVVEQFGRLTIDLRDRVLRARMVQVDNVFSRFPRLVRDLSRDLGKEIQLNIVGGDTELDRTVIDQIGDPLMHLIRNAVDHGIELPDDRLAAGKPRAGRLTLLAYQESNSVVIIIEDDGKGLDLEVNRRKAIELGLRTPSELEGATPEQLTDLIFLPGFSTAGTVTGVSGRGVGMDVVKRVIEGLGGVISLRSQPGKGTTILIRLPLTLAIIQTLLVRVGHETYAVPSNYIEQTVSISPLDIQRVRGQEITTLRGEVLPLMRLNRILETPEIPRSDEAELDVVVIAIGERRIGCVVDQLLKQQDIVIKPLGGYLGKIEGIAGGTVLGDGHVVLILDIRAFA